MTEKPTWTILLIDAQPMSRNTLKSQLEYYQYAVLPADSARSSVQTFQQHQRAIDLVSSTSTSRTPPAPKCSEFCAS